MEQRLYIADIEKTFYKKKLIKRSPNTALLKQPFIKLKISCKHLNKIASFYYFENMLENTTKKEEAVSDFNQNISMENSNKSLNNKSLKLRKEENINTKNSLINNTASLENKLNFYSDNNNPYMSNQDKVLKKRYYVNSPGVYYEMFLISENNKNNDLNGNNDIVNIKKDIENNMCLYDKYNIKKVFTSKVVFYNSPKWINDVCIEVNKLDKILIKIYKTTYNSIAIDTNYNTNINSQLVCFQILPVYELEVCKLLEGNIAFNVIEESLESFMNKNIYTQDNEISDVNNNHYNRLSLISKLNNQQNNSIDLIKNNYLNNNTNNNNNNTVTDKFLNNDNHHSNNRIKFFSLMKYKLGNIDEIELFNSPMIIIKFDYYTFSKLWKLSAIIHTIIQRELDANNKVIKDNYCEYNDEVKFNNNNNNISNSIDQLKSNKNFVKRTGKFVYQYKLYCKRNDGLCWFKEVSFNEIELFRNKMLKELPELKNIPFPYDSVLSKIPFIGRFYSDENDDILIEKKFIIDNFFENLLEREEAYKTEEFNTFFSSD